jgi:hydroxymethylpyrimidine pyrophosphatase-like HAD family hydrolase
LVLYNGSLVLTFEHNAVLHMRTIDQTVLANVLRLATRTTTPVLAYYYSPTVLVRAATEYVCGWNTTTSREFNGMPVLRPQEPNETPNQDPLAILLDVGDQATERADELCERLQDLSGLTATKSGAKYIELRPVGSNKAVALERVAAHVGIRREEIMALGDNDNDAEMLRWAGLGVAVSGASERALSAAQYRCHHGVARGVVEVLRLMKAARRYYPPSLPPAASGGTS